MPRVHHVKKARKDNPAVVAGESYYWWKFPYSFKRYSKTRPRPSQLTQSDKLARLYEAEELLDCRPGDESPAELADLLKEAASQVREVGEEYQESAENILQAFESSPTAEECEERSYACEALADSLEEMAVKFEEMVEGFEVDEEDDEAEPIDPDDLLSGIDWSVG